MTTSTQNGARSVTVLKDRYKILLEPAADFATPTAQAFFAEDERAASIPLVALILDPNTPYRADALRVLKGIETPGLMTLVDYGVVDWAPYGRKVMTLIYERPLGGRVMSVMNGEFTRIEGSELLRKALVPLATALRQLAGHKLTHRAVRPTNMYWATPERSSIVLGDCAAAPPAFEQPIAVETIESALTHPAGRGNGRPSDELYALGVSMLILLSGRNPMSGISQQEIVRSKITEGSYQAMARNERVPVHLIEMVKGLLNDDAKVRWDQTALDDWIGGKRRPNTQSKIEKRAAREFEFDGAEYFSTRELAIAFCANWEAAIPVVADGRLEQWLRRSLGIEDMADAVVRAMNERASGTIDRRIADDVMLCRVCLVLDGSAPIRCKNVSVMPDGIGALLAVTMAKGADVNAVIRIMRREVQKAWTDTREVTEESKAVDTKLRTAYDLLSKQTLGNGIERALYLLNESVPCQSGPIAKEFVVDIRDLLAALDAAAAGAERKAWPIDRHVAAFIGAHATFDVGRQMTETADAAPEKSMLGALNLLATLQWRLGPKKAASLAAVVGGMLKPVINGYHSQRKRRDLERQMEEPIADGDLIALFRLLDDPDERARDRQGYEQASKEWHGLAADIEEIDNDLRNIDDRAAKAAQRLSAVVSMCLAVIIVLSLAAWKR